jgi:hypothetical protein
VRERQAKSPLAGLGEDGRDDPRPEVLEFVNDEVIGAGLGKCVGRLSEGVDDEGAEEVGGLVSEAGEVETEVGTGLDELAEVYCASGLAEDVA